MDSISKQSLVLLPQRIKKLSYLQISFINVPTRRHNIAFLTEFGAFTINQNVEIFLDNNLLIKHYFKRKL